MHPRHPPRAFPLGLRAPRCLGISQCEYTLCRCLFGERKKSSPQRRSPPRSGDTTNTVIFESVILFYFSLRLSDLRSPPSHNPSSLFHFRVCGVAFALTGRDFENGGARQIPDALAEIPEAEYSVLDPPSLFAHTNPLASERTP